MKEGRAEGGGEGQGGEGREEEFFGKGEKVEKGRDKE